MNIGIGAKEMNAEDIDVQQDEKMGGREERQKNQKILGLLN